jgi:DNA-binding transcriptional ArsR family regulator
MLRESYHPNAYLSTIRNIRRGLKARTQVLGAIEKGAADARAVADGTGMRYGVAVHHLKLLQKEGIVERKGSRPSTWTLTGIGQKRLANST